MLKTQLTLLSSPSLFMFSPPHNVIHFKSCTKKYNEEQPTLSSSESCHLFADSIITLSFIHSNKLPLRNCSRETVKKSWLHYEFNICKIFHPNFFVCSSFNLKLCKKLTMLSSFHSSYGSVRFCIMHCQNYANLKLVWWENVVAFRVWGRNEWGYHLRELQQLQQKTFCHLFPGCCCFSSFEFILPWGKYFSFFCLLLNPANDNDNDIMMAEKA